MLETAKRLVAMHTEHGIVTADLSICSTPVMCLNEWTYGHIFDEGRHSSFFEPQRRYKIPRRTPQRGVIYTAAGEFCN